MSRESVSPPSHAHQREGDGRAAGCADEAAVQALAQRVEVVRQRMATACRRVGRDPQAVRLLPVSKTVPAERLRAAMAAGCTAFGENKVQEAQQKAEALADLAPDWIIIGHLQGNKAKAVARFAREFQALDRLALAETLQRRLDLEDRTLDVLVQVNTSGEASKFGLTEAAVLPLLRALPDYPRLRVRGLMTLAVFSADDVRVRQCFARLRQLRDRLRQSVPDGIGLDELSMGMSGDFEIAIEEGATTVRVGQAIFGARPLPDSHYWPEAPLPRTP